MPLLLIAALVVAFLAVIFALQNAAPISVSLAIWEFEASLAIILLITLAIGFFVGLCVVLPALIRRNLRISRQKKQVAQLQSELIEAKAPGSGEGQPSLPAEGASQTTTPSDAETLDAGQSDRVTEH